MNPSQKRRLASLAGQVGPCIGCLRENLAEATLDATGFRQKDYDLLESLHGHVNARRIREGQEPEPPYQRPSPEELRERAAYGQAVIEQHRDVLREALRLVPAALRRESCPDCSNRKRRREQCSALAKRLAQNAREREQEDEEFKATFDYPGSAS